MECEEWEGDNARAWDYAAKGRGAQVEAWDLSVELEASAEVGMRSVAFLSDLRKFYERVPHGLVLKKAVAHKFPLTVALLAVGQYRGRRRIGVSRCLTEAVTTSQGIVAGCALATTLVKVILLDVLDEVLRAHPRLRVAVYLDDIKLVWRGFSVLRANDFIEGVRMLVRLLEEGIYANVSRDKSLFIASSKALLDKVIRDLSDLGFEGCAEARLVGVDLCWDPSTAGGNAHPSRPVRKKRMMGMRSRRKRIGAIKRAGGDAVKLWATGELPRVAFGRSVLGTPPGDLLEIRRAAGAASLPGGGGRSLTIGFLIHRRQHMDPICDIGIAPIVEWSKQVWWRRAASSMGILKLAFRYAARRIDSVKDVWRVVNGPGTATIASLARLGWTMPRHDLMISDLQERYDLLRYSPLRLRRRLLEACVRWQCAQTTSADLKSIGVELDWAHLRQQLHGKSSKLSTLERGALRSLVDGSAWDAVRRWQCGYAESPACRRCGDPWGSRPHCVWRCRDTEDRRVEALPEAVIVAGAAARDDDPHWNRCLPLPVHRPRPRCRPTQPPQWIRDQVYFTGEVYIDGSAFETRIGWLQAAGCSAVMLLSTGEGVQAEGIYGTVDGEDQHSGDGELAGLVNLVKYAVPPVHVVTDCAMIVSGLIKGERWATSWRRLQADRWLEVYDIIRDWDAGSMAVTKVKAHRSREVLHTLDRDERRQWWGNHFADVWAKKGAGLHRATARETAEARRGRSLQAAVARWAASTICADAHEYPWDRMGRRWDPVRVIAGRSISALPRHDLIVDGAVLRCSICEQWAFTESYRCKLRALPCPGSLQSRLEKVGRAVGRQHCLMRSIPITCQSSLPLLWCAVCGAYAESAARNLTRPCLRRATRAGRNAIGRLGRGLHPRRDTRYYDGQEVLRQRLLDPADGEARGDGVEEVMVHPENAQQVDVSGFAGLFHQFDDPEATCEEQSSDRELDGRQVVRLAEPRSRRFAFPPASAGSEALPEVVPEPSVEDGRGQSDGEGWWRNVWADGSRAVF